MQFGRGNAARGQLAGQAARGAPGPGEHERPAAAAREGRDDTDPVVRGDGQHVVGHRGRRLGRAEIVVHRAVHEPPGQDVDGGVERRGEQHPLAVGRGHAEKPPYHGQEAEVGHVVRLVEHADLDVAEVAVALLNEVGQPARARDHDVGAVTKAGHLRFLGYPAVDRGHAQPDGSGQRREHGVDLAGEFPGWHQDQAARAAGAGVAVD